MAVILSFRYSEDFVLFLIYFVIPVVDSVLPLLINIHELINFSTICSHPEFPSLAPDTFVY